MGCRSRPPAESVAAPTSTAVSAPFDVASVMRQVHFAYRPEGEQWSGGHSTYEVRASTNGMSRWRPMAWTLEFLQEGRVAASRRPWNRE